MQDQDNRDLVQILIEDPDPVARSQAHTQLGHRARDREEIDHAVTHYREALVLDPTDEEPREALRELGRPVQVQREQKRGVLQRVWRRVKGGSV